MRVRMVCALGVALVSVCMPTRTKAQAKSEPGQSTPPNASITKEPSVVTVLPVDARLAHVRRWQYADLLLPSKGDVEPLEKFQVFIQSYGETEPPFTCGHIVIYPAPRNLDSGMIIQVPKESLDTTPAYPGVPACGRDIRTTFFKLPQGPVLLLPRPGRNGTTLVDAKKQQNPN